MDYETRAASRKELRLFAEFFRTICELTPNEPVDPVLLLDKLPDYEGFDNVYYDIVEDQTLPKHVPARCTLKNDDNSNNLILMFNYDKVLLSLWNSPLKKIALFKTCAAIATPDFSIYPTMNYNEIRHNVYMNRWLGCTWQSYGCTVIPTVGWADPGTYDICFSGLEYGSVVIISTIGCQKHKDIFLDGFYEMKSKINPPLIIVVGDMIKGMTGTFCNFRYTESFNNNFKQLKIEQVFTVKEVI